MMNQLYKDLAAAKKLINDPADWTQNKWLVEDGHGRRSMCAEMAIKIAVDCDMIRRKDCVDAVLSVVNLSMATFNDLATFNDTNSHGQVMNAFDRAIALALDASIKARVEELKRGEIEELVQ